MLSDQVWKHLFSWHLSETSCYPTTFIGNRSSCTATTHCCMLLQFKQLYAFTHILTAISLHVVYMKTFYNAKVITFRLHSFIDVQTSELSNYTWLHAPTAVVILRPSNHYKNLKVTVILVCVIWLISQLHVPIIKKKVEPW